MKKLKEGFRKLFLITTVLALLFASCKHQGTDQNNNPKTETITVTVNKDSHITKVIESFTLEKGSKLGFTALKDKLKPLEFEATYQLAKITLDNENGTEITNSKPHTFNENTTIYIHSQKESLTTKLELKELKVDGNLVTIKDSMNAEKTKKEKVLIEARASIPDANIEYEPKLDKDNFWVLKDGKQSLKITVKKGSDSKEYTLNIEKLDADSALLKKLTVGEKSKEGGDIEDEMIFTVAKDVNEVEIKAETEPANAQVVFEPSLTNGKLTLSTDETSVKIKVGTEPKVVTYTVKVRKITPALTLVNGMLVQGGKKNGVAMVITQAQAERILTDHNDVLIELAGPIAEITLVSKTQIWRSAKINGKKFEVFPAPFQGFASVCMAELDMCKRNETMDVKIEIASDTSSVELNFKIKRLDTTVDIPANKLIIRDKNVITKKDDLVSLLTGKKPEFEGAEPSNIEIQCEKNAMKSVTIDGKDSEIKNKKNENDIDVYYAENQVTGVQPSGKEVSIVMQPINSEDYNTTTWTFKLKYVPPMVIGTSYEFNGNDEYALDETFVQKLNNGENPTLQVQGSYLNIKLSANAKIENVIINAETLTGDKIEKIGSDYQVLHSIQLGSEEKNIDIEINPSDTGTYTKKTYKFKAKGDGTLEKLNPTFEEISGDKNLPKATFIDKLTTGEKPIHQIHGDVAKIVFSISGYDWDFLCNEVKIDGEKTELKRTGGTYARKYIATKDIAINPSTPVPVKVEFIPKAGKATPITWEFQVQGGGQKPSIPQNKIGWFRINGFGGYAKPFEASFKNHLIDGTSPEFVFDGKEALVEVGAADAKIIQKVVFRMDGEDKAEIIPTKQGFFNMTKYKFEVSDTNPHPTEVIVYPKDEQNYSELKYSFTLKSSGKKVPPAVVFGIDRKIQQNGYKATLPAETASLLVQTKEDVMEKVEIGVKGSETEVTIEKFTAQVGGNNVWQGEKLVSLANSNGDFVEQTFVIRVTPKDKNKYDVVECEYTLTGTKCEATNAEFIFEGKNPKVYSNITWLQGISGSYLDDYGAKAVNLEAYTVSQRAHVKYQFVDLDNKPIAGQTEHELTFSDLVHKSGEVALFQDKPTRVKAWVVAEDNSTTNESKGVWYQTFNPVPLTWGYELKEKGADYETKAYDEIVLEKDLITDPSNKIYLVFAPWKEDDGYTVDNSTLAEGQTQFEKLETLGKYQQYYRTTLDVSKLKDNSSTELKVILKMKKNNIDCLTYEVKVKIK